MVLERLLTTSGNSSRQVDSVASISRERRNDSYLLSSTQARPSSYNFSDDEEGFGTEKELLDEAREDDNMPDEDLYGVTSPSDNPDDYEVPRY